MLTIILLCAVLFLMVVIWSIKRHRVPRLRIKSDAPLSELLPSLAGLTHATLGGGNSVQGFEHGAFSDTLVHDMAGAQRSLHFETYLWEEVSSAGASRRCSQSARTPGWR